MAENPSTQENVPVTAPAAVEAPVEQGNEWPEISTDHPLAKLLEKLPEILEKADYNSVYGLTLVPEGSFHTKLILQKFLRANANDVGAAEQQLIATLKWRKKFKPEATLTEEHHPKFTGLGYVVELAGVKDSENKTDVAAFNIYGVAKGKEELIFGDLEEFLRWRVGVMELTLSKLNLADATKPIPNYGDGPDPYQAIQVHDYLNVSFLRQNPYSKAAASKTIELFKSYYPETLSRKFFINIPAVMGWVFTAMKAVLPAETVRKFSVLSYGNTLVNELGDSIPVVYGGKGGELVDIGEELRFAAEAQPSASP
ncbi:CRAL/TRIO domain-containing protein [Aulographum hederae CBS 113979]|uniref:Phosphatidylinositol transfer protein SFH5 n=1 Tax=Aulographum hederae CBS 113979 TaxID=1176131 RepID=A0A6G1H2F9_9PEZI|nr:CRAL/TRIO domain-containing protein [Aulographum hederae CBS 113979]